jgi:hypothetical protein
MQQVMHAIAFGLQIADVFGARGDLKRHDANDVDAGVA